MKKVCTFALILLLAALPVMATSMNYTAASSSAVRGTRNQLILGTATVGVTTGTSTVIVTDYKVLYQTILIRWHGTCSGGTVVVEAATLDSWDHTWAPIATISAHSNIEDVVTLAFPTHSVRVRVTSDVTGGGTIWAYYTGANF